MEQLQFYFSLSLSLSLYIFTYIYIYIYTHVSEAGGLGPATSISFRFVRSCASVADSETIANGAIPLVTSRAVQREDSEFKAISKLKLTSVRVKTKARSSQPASLRCDHSEKEQEPQLDQRGITLTSENISSE